MNEIVFGPCKICRKSELSGICTEWNWNENGNRMEFIFIEFDGWMEKEILWKKHIINCNRIKYPFQYSFFGSQCERKLEYYKKNRIEINNHVV